MTATTPHASPPPDQQSASTGQEQLASMSLGEHLEELRRRLSRALLAVVFVFLALTPFKREVTEVMLGPYRALWRTTYREFIDGLQARAGEPGGLDEYETGWLAFYDKHGKEVLDGTFAHPHLVNSDSHGGFSLPYELVATKGLEDFWTFMGMSILFALVMASPIVLYQAWAFVAAGLYPNERRVFYRYFPLAGGLMSGGILFGYFAVVPYGLYFLVRLMFPGQVRPLLTVGQYFSLLVTLTAALGVVFQLPLVMVALQKVGLVTHRAFVKNWRYVVISCFIVAAFLTPPDPFTQALMAVPMVLLFLLGLLLTRRGAAQDADAVLAAQAGEGE